MQIALSCPDGLWEVSASTASLQTAVPQHIRVLDGGFSVHQDVSVEDWTVPPMITKVLALTALSFSNADIGRAVGISPATVKVHHARVSSRLHTYNRVHSLARCFDAGVFSVESRCNPREYELTPRQYEVLELCRQGLTTARCARPLQLSHDTVKQHRDNIIQKTPFGGIETAVTLGFLTGLLVPRPVAAKV